MKRLFAIFMAVVMGSAPVALGQTAAAQVNPNTGALITPTASTFRSANSVERLRTVNVKDYGAVGDGVTNDHAAIALAVAVVNATRGLLFFPEGTYLDNSSHTFTGPQVVHSTDEAGYNGNIIVAGAGTASVWKYTGSGTFLTVTSGASVPSNVVFRDLQINGPSQSPWDGTSIGVDIIETGVDYQFDNVGFANWGKVALRAWDTTSLGLRQVAFRRCKLGFAGDFKLDGAVFDRVVAQNCDVGMDLGYYNSGRVYGISPPPVEGVVLNGCIFGVNRIGLIIGGVGSSGVNVIGGYFEGQTDADIDIGHNTTDYAGLALETTGAVRGVAVTGCYFQSTIVCRVWCPTTLTFTSNGYNGATAPYVRLKNANADTSTVTLLDTVANGLGYSGGTNVSAPLTTGTMRHRGDLIVDNATIAGLMVNAAAGGFPGVQIQLAAAVKAYWVVTGVNGSFLTDSLVGDMIFRSEANRILFGVGASNSSLVVSGTQVVMNADAAMAKTITAGGTTGAQTINKNAGSVNFAAAATSLVVTDSRVTTASVIVATVATNDATMKSVLAVPAAGSFTLHANAAATAETRVNFVVIN